MFRSVTLKLTLVYVLLAIILSLLFSSVLYHFSTDELSDALSEQYKTLSVNDHDSDNAHLPSEELDRHSGHLLAQLIYFNIFVIVGSTIVSYILARRTLRPIEQAHRSQIRFTAEASHELRTPLAAMRADTEVALMEKGLNPKARRTLQGNVDDIRKLEQLASHLLDISRYQAGYTSPHELLNLDEITADALRQLNHVIKAKHLSVKLNIKPVQLLGDNYAVRQLITIVLDNATKYSQTGGTIAIKLTAENKQAVVVITDTGIGIPPSDLPHLFERFYRSTNTRGNEPGMNGYGLGLPLAQEIVQAHKGSIHISSKEHLGSEVVIKLPIANQ
ncbi:MAG: HAMP domain-containing sensor histidine kinase [Candidatus Saccharimonadales bacterium]